MTVVSLASVALLASCGSTSSKKTEIEFFTQKKETLGITKEIAKDFEKVNKDIKVKVVSVPDPSNVLKTRISSKDTPDVVNIYPQNSDFKEWAANHVFEA